MNAKTVRMTVCLLVLIVSVPMVFSVKVFAQNHYTRGDYHDIFFQLEKNDKDDRDWGLGDWRFREKNKQWSEQSSYVRYQPKTLYEWLDDTRQTFKKAEATLTTPEEKKLLAACQKTREAGIIREVFEPSTALGQVCRGDETLRMAYTGPFESKYGRRDHQFMFQIFYIKAWDNWKSANGEFADIYSQSSEEAKFNVMMAVFKAKGKTYATHYCQLFYNDEKKAPAYELTYPFCQWMYFLSGPNQTMKVAIAQFHNKDVERWRAIFNNLSDPNAKEPVAGSVRSLRGGTLVTYDLSLLLDSTGMLGNPSTDSAMITRDEFLFISRQADQAWQNLLNPPEEFLKDLPRFTYWQRDAEPNEPPLILKVQIPKNQKYEWHISNVTNISNHLPTSFLKGLCPEWKQALADFGKSSVDQKLLNEKERELYLRYFAGQRSKWHKISAEEYAKLKAEQEEWSKIHPATDIWAYKQKLCGHFQFLAGSYNDDSSAGVAMYTLKALELPPQLSNFYDNGPNQRSVWIDGEVINTSGRILNLRIQSGETLSVKIKDGARIEGVKDGAVKQFELQDLKIDNSVTILLDIDKASFFNFDITQDHAMLEGSLIRLSPSSPSDYRILIDYFRQLDDPSYVPMHTYIIKNGEWHIQGSKKLLPPRSTAGTGMVVGASAKGLTLSLAGKTIVVESKDGTKIWGIVNGVQKEVEFIHVDPGDSVTRGDDNANLEKSEDNSAKADAPTSRASNSLTVHKPIYVMENGKPIPYIVKDGKLTQMQSVSYTGDVISISDRNLTLHVKGETLVVKIKDGARILLATNLIPKEIKFQDIKVGDTVTVELDSDNAGTDTTQGQGMEGEQVTITSRAP